MKKIGILTFCNADNYGALLQAYALKTYLSKENDVEFINLKFNKENSNNNVISSKYTLKNKIIGKLKHIKFDKFRKKHFKLTSEINGDNEINKKELNYDYYIVGSDQVWNTNITNNTKAFFLNFADGKKISYAASYGKRDLNETEKMFSQEELKKFDAISVRELCGAEYINNELNLNAMVVCDPVFLLEREKWVNDFNLNNNNKRKYILVYYMEQSDLIYQIVKKIKNKMNIEVKYICGGSNRFTNEKHELFAGPDEFINYIYNAELIITNSFHAIAFSMIFGKKFLAISHSKWNARLENILSMSKNIDNLINNNSENIDLKIIDGEKAYDNIKNIINDSKEFLRKSIDVDSGGDE